VGRTYEVRDEEVDVLICTAFRDLLDHVGFACEVGELQSRGRLGMESVTT
jgi:hypothetical protein